MRISDWRSDVCSSELQAGDDVQQRGLAAARRAEQGVGAAVLPDVVDLLQREVGVALRPVEIGVGERVERDPRHASSPLRVTGGRRHQAVVAVEDEEAGGGEVDRDALAIGRGTGRGRVGQSGYISVVAVSLKKKNKQQTK